MPAFRVDWNKVKAISSEAGLLPDDVALFALPVSGRDIIMSMFERFTWEATFRTDDYDYSDWDSLQAIVAATENGLMGTILMDDLVQQLTRIADSLEAELCCTQDELIAIRTAIEGISLVVNCGGGGGTGNPLNDWRVPADWVNDWPTAPTDEDGTPTTQPTGNLCDAAHSAWFELDLWFQQFADNVGNENPYQDLVDDLNDFQLANPYVQWIWEAMNAVVALLYDQLLIDVSNFWLSMKNDFICKVLEVDNAIDLRSWVFTTIRANPPTWSAGYYMEVLLTGTTFNGLYDGTYVPFPQFIGSDCLSCQADVLPSLPAGWYWAPLDASHITNFSVNTNPDLTLSAVGNDFTVIKSAYGLQEEAMTTDPDQIKLDAGGEVYHVRRGYLLRFTSCTLAVSTEDNNINNNVNPINSTPNSRCGWTNTGRYQFRFQNGNVGVVILDAIDAAFSSVAIMPVSTVGSGDQFANTIGAVLNSVNTSDSYTFRMWYMVQTVAQPP